MIDKLITELVEYGINHGLVDEADRWLITNRLIELFGMTEYSLCEIDEVRAVNMILNDMLEYAVDNRIIEEDSTLARDLFDTKQKN